MMEVVWCVSVSSLCIFLEGIVTCYELKIHGEGGLWSYNNSLILLLIGYRRFGDLLYGFSLVFHNIMQMNYGVEWRPFLGLSWAYNVIVKIIWSLPHAPGNGSPSGVLLSWRVYKREPLMSWGIYLIKWDLQKAGNEGKIIDFLKKRQWEDHYLLDLELKSSEKYEAENPNQIGYNYNFSMFIIWREVL